MNSTIASDDRKRLVDTLCDDMVNAALGDFEPRSGFASICEQMVAAGLPLARAHLSMRTLHPLVRAVALTWTNTLGVEIDQFEFGSDADRKWQQSPSNWMLQSGARSMQIRLDDANQRRRFPLFEDLHAAGGTEYRATIVPFGDPETARARGDGVILSWVCRASGGFSERDIEDIRRLEPLLALGAKISKREFTARNICSAYMGEAVGRRVLDGQIRLGDVDEIPAVIWYCDLRDSTAMADRMAPRKFLAALNAYFECMAGAVLDHNGEVLRFIGDAVLAVFPVADGGALLPVAKQALDAAQDAQRRIETVNASRATPLEERLGFGLALHVGTVLYGNIGVPTRLEFSVIGRAANEVCRMEGLTKHLGHPILVSRAFAEAVAIDWIDAGSHLLSGVSGEQSVYAPPP